MGSSGLSLYPFCSLSHWAGSWRKRLSFFHSIARFFILQADTSLFLKPRSDCSHAFSLTVKKREDEKGLFSPFQALPLSFSPPRKKKGLRRWIWIGIGGVALAAIQIYPSPSLSVAATMRGACLVIYTVNAKSVEWNCSVTQSEQSMNECA